MTQEHGTKQMAVKAIRWWLKQAFIYQFRGSFILDQQSGIVY